MSKATLIICNFLVLSLFFTATSHALVCDVDVDGDVDRTDIMLIFAARRTLAAGPDDPADPTRDGDVTVRDGRACILQCTLPRCESPTANTPPVSDAGSDQTVTVGDTVTLNGSGSADIDGDTLSYSWSFLDFPGGSTAILSDPTAVMPTFVADLAGDYVVALIVNDGKVDSPPDDVVIITAPGNTAPVADAGPDQTVLVGDTVLLDGAGSSDVDGDALTYFWTLAAAPTGSGATLSDNTAVMPTFTADLAGDYLFELVVDDGLAGSLPDFVTITTANTPPVADAGPDQTVALGDLVTLDGSGSSDTDGDPLSFAWSLASRPPGSTAVLASDNTTAPTFVADAPGTFVAQLVVDDGTVSSAPATVVVVTSNTQPVANAGADQTAQVGDTVVLDGSASNDADSDPLTYSWSFAARPGGSTATLDDATRVAPSFVADIDGTYVAQLIVSDGQQNSDPDTTTVIIEVEPNSSPVANDDSLTTDEDVAVSFNAADLLGNDTDDDGDDLSITGVSQGTNGAVTGTSPDFTYTPDADFNGQDFFTYSIDDGNGGTDSATVTVTVDAINDAPTANDDTADTNEDVAVTIDVLANDTDPDNGDSLSISSVTQGGNGSVSTTGTDVTYTPNTNFTGVDSFTYVVADGNGGTDSASVTVDVGAANDDPIAADDATTIDEDTVATVSVLDNDSDPDGDSLTVTGVTDGTHGAVTTNGATTSYTPDVNFNGSDSFTYTVSDGNGGTGTATVNVTINAVNDAPEATDDTASTDEETTVTIDVLGNDTDIDGDSLSLDSTTDGSGGSTVIASGLVEYTPEAGFTGDDTFTYIVADGNGGTDTGTVAVSVSGVNDPPDAVDDTAATDEDGSVTVDVLANDTDPDGDMLTIQSVTDGANGTAVNNGDDVTYTPNRDFSGSDNFSYTVSDGNGGTDAATVTVTVNAVNDQPTANDDTAATDEDVAVTIDVLANDTDPDGGDSLTVSAVTQGSNGSVSTGGSDVTYTPAINFFGDDTFTYTISDGNGGTDTATVDVTINAINDAPVANAGPDQNVLITDVVQLDGSGSGDAEGDTVTYLWSVQSGPTGSAVNFSNPTTQNPTATFTDVGTYVLELQVSDAGQSGTDTVMVVVSPAPVISIRNDSVTEGDAGTVNASFEVNLSFSIDRVVTVQFATANGTASVADNDYVANSGIITFPANTTGPQFISVTVNGDTDIENNETFFVNLTTPVNAVFGDNQATGNILSDDIGANMTLSPGTLNLLTFANGNLTVTLGAPAGAGGVDVTLTSSNPGAATVPANVTVEEGNTQAQIPVTGGATTGGTTITAAASGFTTETSVVSVTNRTLDIALNDPLVGVGRSVGGTVTLAQPAPMGGTTVALSSDATGIATVAPVTITIPEGQKSGSFDVSGISVGVASISASAPGYDGDSTTATVTNNLINLGVLQDIGPGESTGLPLSITNPAPPGGLTVNFVSSDPSIATVTPSITIPAGDQLPSANPQVTGVNIGTATITATAAGFSPDTRDVIVTLTFEFSPVNFTVVETNTRDITLNLSAPAPAGGLVVPLSITDTGVASVPANVTVPVGQTSVPVPVSGVMAGDTVLTTNLPGTTPGTANIEVTVAPPINFGDVIIGDDLQASLNGNLGQAAPAGNLTVTITSADPARLLIAPDKTTPGSASITRTVNAGSKSIGLVYFQALDDTGTAEFTSSAPGYATDTSTVTFAPSGIDIYSPSSISTTSFSGNVNIRLCSWRLRSTDLVRLVSQEIRPPLSVDIPVTSSDTDVGDVTVSPVTLNAGQNCVTATQFDPFAAGTTTVAIEQPSGFQVPASGQSIEATVTAPNVNLTSSVMVGEDLQTPFNVNLQSAPPAPVNVTVTIADNTRALISSSNTVVGGDTVTFVGVSGTSAGTVYLQGLKTGSTTVSASAPGYNSDSMNIEVQPSGFDIYSPASINTQTFANNSTVTVCAWRLRPADLVRLTSQDLMPGISASVPVTSSDTNVGTITTSPVVIGQNDNCESTQFDPLNAGTSTIAITQPPGFETPSARQQITATVTAPNLTMPTTSNVGEDLQTNFAVNLQNAPPSPVDVTVTIDDPGVAIISNGSTTAGGTSITFPGIDGKSVGTIWVQGLSRGTATINATATGYNPDSTAVTVSPSGFDIYTPNAINTQTFANNQNVTICAWRLSDDLLRQNSQDLRVGVSASIAVTSSNTSVGAITSSPVVINQVDNCATTQFDPISNGTTQIAISTPLGFDTPGGSNPRQEITATVDSPNLNLPSARIVGEDLQNSFNVTLENAPPDPVDVTITSSSAAIVTLSKDPLLEGGGSVTFTGVTGTNVGSVYVQGRSSGNAQITGTAAGYQDDVTDVTVQPSGFDINTPADFTIDAGAADRSVQICAWRLDPTFLTRIQSMDVRGGLTVDVPVLSSDTDVGTITISPVSIGPSDNCENTAFDPASAGTSTISITTPGGFETPSARQSITATVTGAAASALASPQDLILDFIPPGRNDSGDEPDFTLIQ